MKRLFLLAPQKSREKGGIQNWMYYTAKLLEENGYRVSFYAYREESPPGYFRHFACGGAILATWKMALPILPTLLVSKKDVFIFVHGNEILDFSFFLKPLIDYLVHRKRTYFIANSKAVADLFFRRFGRKVDLVQHPFLEIRTNLPNKKAEGKRFLTISRLVKRKNIDTVLRAFAKLRKEGFDFRYEIGGSGPQMERLERLTYELGLEENVKFLGHLSEEQKAACYEEADFFLLPSIYDRQSGSIEGYGIVYIEANMYGIPVLSGDTGGMVEAVIDGVTGLHSDGTIESVAEKIVTLTRYPFNRMKILEHAREHDYRIQNRFLNFIGDRLYGC